MEVFIHWDDLDCNGTIALNGCTGTSHGVGVSA